ncbi:MAG: DUF6622 family protein [Rhodospirillales bacterium]
MDHFLAFIAHTPVWIWFLFAMLIWVGHRRSRPRVTTLRTMLILPLVILGVYFNFMWGFTLDSGSLGGWALGLGAGVLLGWLITRGQPVRADHENALVGLPGSWTTMIIIVLIFTTRFYFGYYFTTYPELKFEPIYILARLTTIGFFTGLFFGRVFGHLAQYKRAPSEDLSGEPRGFIPHPDDRIFFKGPPPSLQRVLNNLTGRRGR